MAKAGEMSRGQAGAGAARRVVLSMQDGERVSQRATDRRPAGSAPAAAPTLDSRSSSSVSRRFCAARPSWSSLTSRMMWFQLYTRIISNQTLDWWE